MTTIVVDQSMNYIAADCQAVDNDCDVAGEYHKIRTIKKNDGVHLLASSGHEASAQIFEEWYELEDVEPLDPLGYLEECDQFTTVILKPKGEIWVADHFCRPYRVYTRWYATGTGGPFAYAVLKAGCGIEKAMTTAIKMDPHSGFGYDIEYLKDWE